jgi:hypothetical protein
MLAVLAIVCFVIAAIGIGTLGPIVLVPLGLAFLAAHVLYPWSPWNRARP